MTTWIDGPAASALLRMTPDAFRQYAHRHPEELPPGPIRNRRRCYDLEHVVRLAEARQLDADEASRHSTNARTDLCPEPAKPRATRAPSRSGEVPRD